MKATLNATARPMLAGNMTRQELLREAEHTFPNPSPIVRRMMEMLAGTTLEAPIVQPVQGACQCPTCGAHLTIDIQPD